MHPNEPKLDELKAMQKALYTAKSTDEDMKKLKAITLQIERIQKEIKNHE